MEASAATSRQVALADVRTPHHTPVRTATRCRIYTDEDRARAREILTEFHDRSLRDAGEAADDAGYALDMITNERGIDSEDRTRMGLLYLARVASYAFGMQIALEGTLGWALEVLTTQDVPAERQRNTE